MRRASVAGAVRVLEFIRHSGAHRDVEADAEEAALPAGEAAPAPRSSGRDRDVGIDESSPLHARCRRADSNRARCRRRRSTAIAWRQRLDVEGDVDVPAACKQRCEPAAADLLRIPGHREARVPLRSDGRASGPHRDQAAGARTGRRLDATARASPSRRGSASRHDLGRCAHAARRRARADRSHAGKQVRGHFAAMSAMHTTPAARRPIGSSPPAALVVQSAAETRAAARAHYESGRSLVARMSCLAETALRR